MSIRYDMNWILPLTNCLKDPIIKSLQHEAQSWCNELIYSFMYWVSVIRWKERFLEHGAGYVGGIDCVEVWVSYR